MAAFKAVAGAGGYFQDNEGDSDTGARFTVMVL